MIKAEKDITFICDTKRGIKRLSNQDDVLILETNDYRLFFLFDGVSSMDSSIVLVKQCKSFITKNFEKYFTKEIGLAQLLFDTHEYVLERKILGLSTCSAVYLSMKQGKSYFVNIGDSRIYDFTNQYLIPISKDDLLPGSKNIITKSLGADNLNRNDFCQYEFTFSNGLLLCSDGFYHLMEAEKKKYFSIFHFKRGENIKRAIVKQQIGRNFDDSTYILIKGNGV
jgi:serine/threonine protein phosphatase PrpC